MLIGSTAIPEFSEIMRREKRMTKVITKLMTTAALSGALTLMPPQVNATENTEGLYASWCLTGMATELDGERTPDKATYTFTKDNQLTYDTGFFKQQDSFAISGDKITTNQMGNYKIIAIKSDEMILNYGGYLFFSKGSCQ